MLEILILYLYINDSNKFKVEFNESNLYLKVSWDDMGNSVQVYKVFRNKTVGSRPIFSGLGKK